MLYVLERISDGALKLGYTETPQRRINEQIGGGVRLLGIWQGSERTDIAGRAALVEWKVVNGTQAHQDEWYRADALGPLMLWLADRPKVSIELSENKHGRQTANPRNNLVRLRLTSLEKQDWAQAAGGTGKLSQWIRGVCNAAAERERISKLGPPSEVTPLPAPGMTDLMISPEAIDEALSEGGPQAGGSDVSSHVAPQPPSESVPNAKPKVVGDAIARETGQCNRWMHHRPGVYCGACKRVIGK